MKNRLGSRRRKTNTTGDHNTGKVLSRELLGKVSNVENGGDSRGRRKRDRIGFFAEDSEMNHGKDP